MPPEGDLRAAIVQDAESGRVLMLAWMDAEAERRTRESGEAWFWSRSRQEDWHKGATSGNTMPLEGMAVEELRDDCDGDALLVRVRPNAPACHTGPLPGSAPALGGTAPEPAATRPDGSETRKLLAEGTPAGAQKVGEEAVEAVRAAPDESDERLVWEAADLVYHLYVLLASRGVDIAAV